MANTNAPFGAQPYQNVLHASLYCYVYSNTTALFMGDVVSCNGNSLITKHNPGGMLQMADAADVDTGAGKTLGAVLSLFNSAMYPLLYIPASTTGDGVISGYALVADDPNQLFIMQEDSDGIDNIIAEDIGENADVSVGSGGDTITGRSSHMLDSGTHATTNTLVMKMIGVYPKDTLATADTVAFYTRLICKINNHYFGQNVAGV